MYVNDRAAEPTGVCDRGRGTTRHASAAQLRLGSIRARLVRSHRRGNGSPRPLSHTPVGSGPAWRQFST